MPRTKLPEVLRRIVELEREYGLRVGNVFHAGDGNLHPLVLYDEHVPGEADRAHELADAILVACIDAGGSLTGEHGVGTDKACAMPLMFGEDDLAVMQRLRARLRPGRAGQPGQALPDATPVRRGARPLPAASAREGRPCRAFLKARSTRRALPTARSTGSSSTRPATSRARWRPRSACRPSEEALAPHGQMLALDPPGDPTVGACLAANLSGPRRHRYGTMRDLVIGATVVLGDGTVASSGGKVVKNVAGYDLAKLFCGSEGRLGRIVRLALRLHPVPEASATVIAPAEAANALAVLRSTLVPSAVDVHWPDRLALLFEGSARAVATQVAAARELVGAEPAGDEVWADAAERQAGATGRISFAPGSLDDVLAAEDEAIVRVAAGVAYVPHEVPDPRDPVEIALVERIRAAFDPGGVLV